LSNYSEDSTTNSRERALRPSRTVNRETFSTQDVERRRTYRPSEERTTGHRFQNRKNDFFEKPRDEFDRRDRALRPSRTANRETFSTQDLGRRRTYQPSDERTTGNRFQNRKNDFFEKPRDEFNHRDRAPRSSRTVNRETFSTQDFRQRTSRPSDERTTGHRFQNRKTDYSEKLGDGFNRRDRAPRSSRSVDRETFSTQNFRERTSRSSDDRTTGNRFQNRKSDFLEKPRDEFNRRERVEAEVQGTSSSAPYRLPVTKASSEFIFGRNAVIAALKASRREFYVLYRLTEIPDAHDRKHTRYAQPSSEKDEISTLAREAGVKVIDVDKSWKLAFAQTAGERPHNVR
jgi:hypothetical protein